MSTTNSSDVFGGFLNETKASRPFKNLNLTFGPNHTASITFDASRKDFNLIGPEIDRLLAMDAFSYEVQCVYPISGQYGLSVRLVYYVLLIFSLILRRYEYLSIAALGTSMTYASVACVHAFCLLVRYKYKYDPLEYHANRERPPTDFGDVDLIGIYPVLVAGCVMLTPILHWSTTVRRNNAGMLIKYWGILMYTAILVVLSKYLTGALMPFLSRGIAMCQLDPKRNCTFDEVIEPNGLYKQTSENMYNSASSQLWDRCNCSENCGSIGPSVPFRKRTNMQVWLMSERIVKIVTNKKTIWVDNINILFLLFIIGQGVLGLLQGKWDPAEFRNWIFRHLNGAQERPDQPTFLWRCRYYISKMSAGTVYMGAILAAIVCPLVFISSVVINELVARCYPVNERHDAVGQWSAWVGACFVLLAAVTKQYHSAWIRSAKLGLSTTVRIVKWMFGKAEFRAKPTRAERNKDNSLVENLKDFPKQCSKPFKHAWGGACHAGRRIVLEWKDFRAWHKDPIERSRLPPLYLGEHWQTSTLLPQSAVAPEKSTVVEVNFNSTSPPPHGEGPNSLRRSSIPVRSSTMPIMSAGPVTSALGTVRSEVQMDAPRMPDI